jgi:peptide-methionine (R)-S-oxide reductase
MGYGEARALKRRKIVALRLQGEAKMFDSDRETTKDDSPNLRRRAFLASATAAIGGLALWQWRRPTILQAAVAPGEPKEVTVILFSDAGERLKQVHIAKVVKTDDEWRQQLSGNAFDITRHADTEIAYSGKYWNLHDKGLYRCICCDNALFESATKFESGTGWPSFWQPIAKENVTEIRDSTFGMVRTAVSCTECDAHLGHVFDDGPQPTGLRYCMNSASLRFVKQT